jgi:ArsR family transcriptional regulator, arsenate/arsenite/antimonite-responsive transcriptional repressor / arsenate reductase (thioredoxin)
VMANIRRRAQVHAALGEPVRLGLVGDLLVGDVSPGQLAIAHGLSTNLLAHHLRVLAEAGVIRRVRSEGDRRRTYVQLAIDDPLVAAITLAGAPSRQAPAARVVFVCTQNSARSQLASAVWAGESAIPATSAGTHPAAQVHPLAITVAGRHGLDLRAASTASVDEVLKPGDLIVAVCDNAFEELPEPVRPAVHWAVPDPAGTPTLESFEAAFQRIAERVPRLASALGRA